VTDFFKENPNFIPILKMKPVSGNRRIIPLGEYKKETE